jgi:hypothetical protein
MNINTLYVDFTNDLESFVKAPIQIEPIVVWNPRKPASPERHAKNGLEARIGKDTQIYMLETQNKAFEVIESMLRIFMNFKSYESESIDPIKEQVWLFGYKWLESYYGLLADPHILRSEFYKKEHDRFLAVLKKCLAIKASSRITFVDALREWYPASDLLKDSTDDEDDETDDASFAAKATKNDDPSTTPPVALSVVQPAVVSPPLASPASLASLTKRRLVLTVSRDHAGRSKTRRNLRN